MIRTKRGIKMKKQTITKQVKKKKTGIVVDEKEAKYVKVKKECFEFLEYLNNKYSKLFVIDNMEVFIASEYFLDMIYPYLLEKDFPKKVSKKDISTLKKWCRWGAKNAEQVMEMFGYYKIVIEENGEEVPKYGISYYEQDK
jgi:hypothetical protein